jgi:hypothetical protein
MSGFQRRFSWSLGLNAAGLWFVDGAIGDRGQQTPHFVVVVVHHSPQIIDRVGVCHATIIAKFFFAHFLVYMRRGRSFQRRWFCGRFARRAAASGQTQNDGGEGDARQWSMGGCAADALQDAMLLNQSPAKLGKERFLDDLFLLLPQRARRRHNRQTARPNRPSRASQRNSGALVSADGATVGVVHKHPLERRATGGGPPALAAGADRSGCGRANEPVTVRPDS